jgi:predicted nucleic acid-binding protein
LSAVVVDASVALAWCFPDEDSDYADAVLVALRASTLLVPAIWASEVANGLLVGERRNRLKQDDLTEFRLLLEALSISEESQDLTHYLEHVLPLARRRNLTAYDACYLDLAIRHRAPLATQDSSLRRAAENSSVSLFAI